MKLYPSHKPIDIYNVGFDDDDILRRNKSGKQISDLLEIVQDPIVLALDGPWGSGKSHFLQRWVGAHKLENNGKATTVYFDAFANDYLDDPLIALIGAIDECISDPKKNKYWEHTKKFAAFLAKPTLRIGLATVTAGVSEALGAIAGAGTDKLNSTLEEAAEKFWEKENGRKAAMKQFQNALTQLTSPSQPDANDAKPLIIVIDELDRCRPDYALAILEVIKHFFSVPRVHFILGVNLDALGHSVKSRYGQGINSNEYLKRFITLTMSLPNFIDNNKNKKSSIEYFKKEAVNMGISPMTIELFEPQIYLIERNKIISLRDIEKLLTRIVLLPNRNKLDGYFYSYQIIIASILIITTLYEIKKADIINLNISIEEIKKIYGSKTIIDNDSYSQHQHIEKIIINNWSYLIGEDLGEDEKKYIKFDHFGSTNRRSIMNDIDNDFLSFFSIMQ